MNAIEHGTYAGAQKCDPRCPACRRAATAYVRAWRRSRRQGLAAFGATRHPFKPSGLGWPRST